MFGLLPKLLGGAALIAALTAGAEYVVILQKDKTIAAMQLAAKQAQIDQDAKDAALSAIINKAEQTKLAAIRAAVSAALQKVASDAPTNSCGPGPRDAARFMQQRPGSPGTKAP